mmetsp:Transcript_28934/g.62941  ORF Transcript_28934/g.62941 Transcript_28934/m.62941 type:complete len:262 (-) Transcript_28934:470-1255(-)
MLRQSWSQPRWVPSAPRRRQSHSSSPVLREEPQSAPSIAVLCATAQLCVAHLPHGSSPRVTWNRPRWEQVALRRKSRRLSSFWLQPAAKGFALHAPRPPLLEFLAPPDRFRSPPGWAKCHRCRRDSEGSQGRGCQSSRSSSDKDFGRPSLKRLELCCQSCRSRSRRRHRPPRHCSACGLIDVSLSRIDGPPSPEPLTRCLLRPGTHQKVPPVWVQPLGKYVVKRMMLAYLPAPQRLHHPVSVRKHHGQPSNAAAGHKRLLP